MSRLDTFLFKSRNSIDRVDFADGTGTMYQFPNGFQISVTERGISFQGSSVNYDPGTILQIENAIRWSKLLAKNLREGKGLCPQRECEGQFIMKSNDKGFAWWAGNYEGKLRETNGVSPEKILRAIAREQELNYHESNG